MKVFHKFLYKYMTLFSVFLAAAWLFPQSLYRDCIHPVVDQKEIERMGWTEEECEKMFLPEKSSFVIKWKFFDRK